MGEDIRTNNESLISVTNLDGSADLSKGVAIGSQMHTGDGSHMEVVRYAAGSGFWRLSHWPLTTGKNVLIRNKFLREDTGTHETLKILDDSIVDSGEETGIDPYNTGGFDRSKNWDKRFGK